MAKVFSNFYAAVVDGEDGPLIYIVDVPFFNEHGHLNDDMSKPHVKLIEQMAGIDEVADGAFESRYGLAVEEIREVLGLLGFTKSEKFAAYIKGE